MAGWLPPDSLGSQKGKKLISTVSGWWSTSDRFLISIKDPEDVDGVGGSSMLKVTRKGNRYMGLQRTFLYRPAEAVGSSAIRSKYSATGSAKR